MNQDELDLRAMMSQGDVLWWAVRHMPCDMLDWAAASPNARYRAEAAWRMPSDKLAWAATDTDAHVRYWFAARAEPEVIASALADTEPEIRRIASERRRAAGFKDSVNHAPAT